MDPIIILHAGLATGTVLLFATIGEIFAERSGVMNLGLEGMMLIGAMAAFSVTVATGNGWLGIAVAMLAGGALSMLRALNIEDRSTQRAKRVSSKSRPPGIPGGEDHQPDRDPPQSTSGQLAKPTRRDRQANGGS